MAYRGIKLSTSAICMNWMHMKHDLELMEQFQIDYIHYDVCDSYFVPEFGLPFYLINKIIDNSNISSDYHLMVEEPKRIFEYIPPEKGALVNIHYEACRNLHRELVTLRRIGFAPGVVINPASSLEHIEYVIEEVDTVAVMTVNPGFPSQKMVPQTLLKVQRLSEWRNRVGYNLDILVDGNVGVDNIPKMVAAGADILVLGTSGLFIKDQPLEESFEDLKRAIDEGLTLREEK